MKGIPAIPMVRKLIKFASENNIPIRVSNWKNVKEVFSKYSEKLTAK